MATQGSKFDFFVQERGEAAIMASFTDQQNLNKLVKRLTKTIATDDQIANNESIIKNQNELEDKLTIINTSIENLDSSLNKLLISRGEISIILLLMIE